MTKITQRQAEIIRTIVAEYVCTGIPVGSKGLVEKYGFNYSPATVRKEMSVLEQSGLLTSPHISAGRIPSDEAVQLYIDELIQAYEITMKDKTVLDSLLRSARLQLDQLLRKTAELLSSTSQFIGVVLSPESADSIIKRIELVSVMETQVLAILITASGAIYEKRIRTPLSLNQEDLYAISRFLNRNLQGYELGCIQQRGLSFLKDTNLKPDQIEVATTVAQSLVYAPPTQIIYRSGENQLYQQILEHWHSEPDIGNKLISHLDDKVSLISLINQSRVLNNLSVKVGIDFGGEHYAGIAVLTKSYHVGGRDVGALGVIGLQRMPYEKLIPTIDYTSQLLSDILNDDGINPEGSFAIVVN